MSTLCEESGHRRVLGGAERHRYRNGSLGRHDRDIGRAGPGSTIRLDGNHVKFAMLQTPDGNGRLEIFEYIDPTPSTLSPPGPTRSVCTASPSQSMTSMMPLRSPQGMAATRCGASRPTKTSTS